MIPVFGYVVAPTTTRCMRRASSSFRQPIIPPIRVGRFSYGTDQMAAAEHAWQYRIRP